MSYQHTTQAAGGWSKRSLCEQMGNIGSEVSRALHWKGNDEQLYQQATDRTLELFDLTLDDPRWRARAKEIARAREVFCDAILGGEAYHSTLKDLDRYLFQFALKARMHK